MEHKQQIFQPRYPLSIRLSLILCPLFFFMVLFIAAFSRTALPGLFWGLAISLGLASSLLPFFTIREIRFLDELVVRRHFLPDTFIAFREIDTIENAILLKEGRQIKLRGLKNLDELKTHFQRWKAAKLLKGEQAHPDQTKNLFPQRGFGSYASFWGVMFGVMLTILAPPWLAIEPRWLLAGSFVVVYFIYIYIIPRILY